KVDVGNRRRRTAHGRLAVCKVGGIAVILVEPAPGGGSPCRIPFAVDESAGQAQQLRLQLHGAPPSANRSNRCSPRSRTRTAPKRPSVLPSIVIRCATCSAAICGHRWS